MSNSVETTPRPPADEIRKRVESELSSSARTGYTLLLLFDIAMGAVIASLWLTEDALPPRTHVAFAALVLISLGWAAFFVWTLTRRTLLLAFHRLVAARLSVAFSSVFASGAILLAIMTPELRATSLAAAALGGVMLGVALALLVRARRQLRALLDRRDALARELGR